MTGVTRHLVLYSDFLVSVTRATTDKMPYGRNRRLEKRQDCLTRHLNRLLFRDLEPKFIWNGENKTLPKQIS